MDGYIDRWTWVSLVVILGALAALAALAVELPGREGCTDSPGLAPFIEWDGDAPSYRVLARYAGQEEWTEVGVTSEPRFSLGRHLDAQAGEKVEVAVMACNDAGCSDPALLETCWPEVWTWRPDRRVVWSNR